MSLRSRIRGWLESDRAGAAEERGYSLENPNTPLFPAFGGQTVRSGVSVSERSAMQQATVLACVRVIAETMASLPLITYRRLPNGGKERAKDHPLFALLHDRPNPYMSSMNWREVMFEHALLWGNGYSEIQFDAWGGIAALWPLDPDNTKAFLDSRGHLLYRTTIRGATSVLQPEQVFHLPGMGFDGFSGMSMVRWGAESIGLTAAIEGYQAAFYGNGANAGSILETDKKLDPDKAARLAASWEARFQGLTGAHRTAVLEDGLKWRSTTVTPHDAQTLELLKYGAVQICKLFRVPPHKVQELDKATFSNIQHQSIEFVVDTVRPWAVRWEQVAAYRLFTPQERATIFAEFLIDGLLRGDMASRTMALHTMRNDGVINADEWREIENWNPQPDGIGKKYLANGNMVDVAALPTPAASPAAAARGAELDMAFVEPIVADACGRLLARCTRDVDALERRTVPENFRGRADDLVQAHAAAALGPVARLLDAWAGRPAGTFAAIEGSAVRCLLGSSIEPETISATLHALTRQTFAEQIFADLRSIAGGNP